MAGTAAGVCEPLDAAAKSTVARPSCAPVAPMPAAARPRRDRDDGVRFGGKHFGTTAIRVSAGSSRSLTSLCRNARGDAVGWPNPVDRIRSVKIVRRFGVPRSRPPRRSPGSEPLGMFSLFPAGTSFLSKGLHFIASSRPVLSRLGVRPCRRHTPTRSSPRWIASPVLLYSVE